MTDLDLTPRDVPTAGPGRRAWRNWVIIGVLVVAAGLVLYQALTSARVYFLNVDEAVARQAELGADTFNMQGTVISEPATAADGAMTFTMMFGGVEAPVRHIGDEPTDLFKVGEQVVAKGSWQSDTFISNQLLVKHSEEYVEANPDRLEGDSDGYGPGGSGSGGSDSGGSDSGGSDSGGGSGGGDSGGSGGGQGQ